jgi:hypothetical protein
MLKRKFAYKQAIVRSRNHPYLNYGQIVEIIGETFTEYKVRTTESGSIFTLEKSSLIVNQT